MFHPKEKKSSQLPTAASSWSPPKSNFELTEVTPEASERLKSRPKVSDDWMERHLRNISWKKEEEAAAKLQPPLEGTTASPVPASGLGQKVLFDEPTDGVRLPDAERAKESGEPVPDKVSESQLTSGNMPPDTVPTTTAREQNASALQQSITQDAADVSTQVAQIEKDTSEDKKYIIDNVTEYWIPLTSMLRIPREKRIELFKKIIQFYPQVTTIHLDAYAAAGTTFQVPGQAITLDPGLPEEKRFLLHKIRANENDIRNNNMSKEQLDKDFAQMDVFAEFDEALTQINNQRQQTGLNKRTVKVTGWIESWNRTFPSTELARFANSIETIVNGKIQPPVLTEQPDDEKVIYLDPLDYLIFRNLKEIIVELASKPNVQEIVLDDHFGVRREPRINGQPTNIEDEILARHPEANNDPQWIKNRITEQVKEISGIVHERGKKLTLSIYSSFEKAARLSYQSVAEWLTTKDIKGKWLLDGLNVQLYEESNFKTDYLNLLQTLEKLAGNYPHIKDMEISITIVAAHGKKLPDGSIIKAPVPALTIKELIKYVKLNPINGKQVNIAGFNQVEFERQFTPSN